MSLDVRDKNNLIKAIMNSENILNKNYLNELEELEIVDLSEELGKIDISSKTRFIKINRLLYNKNEDNLEKLTTIIDSVSSANGSIATIIKSNGKKVDYYLGVINKDSRSNITTQFDILEGSLNGNFQGTVANRLVNEDFNRLIDDIFCDEEDTIITSVSGVSSLRNEDKKDGGEYIQGLEKFVDSVRDKIYTAILIADPISNKEINEMRIGYENLYSELNPFLKTELSFNENDSITLTDGITEGITDTINTSISHTQNHTKTSGWSSSENIGKSKTKNYGAVAGSVAAGAGSIIGSAFGPLGTLAGGAIGGAAGSVVGNLIGSNTNSESETTSNNESYSDSEGETSQSGKSKSKSNQKSTSTSEANTRGRSIQISYENRGVKTLLEKIDNQLDRIKGFESFGSFNFSAYFISNDASVNKIAASSYNAIMRGENSSVEASHINTWYESKENRLLSEYLKRLTHPLFKMPLTKGEFINVSPASVISGRELAIALTFPKKSVAGLQVIESVEFGRNIFSETKRNISAKRLDLGNLYYMGKCERDRVKLDIQSLAMHTFITGSTGAGKSNTIYKILDELNSNEIKFLVIEPAKGEYKNIFGYRKDVTVLGTNPYKTKLLKINPFRFPNDIHILEHVDRLIEILNVCWPMYAAMPAVLKESVLRAYKLAGWDLELSVNKYDEELFPTFDDVLVTLNQVINQSDYSEELKGNYIGSLVTRISSLTNGINGRIFSSDEIDNNILFDSNVIVDLSRVGSIETKSMIMGILTMRLQEHRMAQGGMNKPLKHVTVLEEAHNILKKTSTDQSQEGSNLVGKSVEMIANSIAEVRTYGEGFIIADQSPGMLDMSTIRNTNTKIILRLPEFSDRELVGKSATLNDDQIEEISKLEMGVCSIYQNNWLEPILCKVDKFEANETEFIEKDDLVTSNNEDLTLYITKVLLGNHISEKIDFDIDRIVSSIIKARYTIDLKISLIDLLKRKEEFKIEDVSNIISRMYSNEKAFKLAQKSNDFEIWNKIMLENIEKDISKVDEECKEAILQCILREKALDDEEMKSFYFGWSDYMRGRII